MNGLTIILDPLVGFFKNKYILIIVIVVSFLIFYLLFRLSTATLKKLKIEVFQSYPFDMFIPNSGAWSIGYFLIAIIVLGALVFFFIKGNFYIVGPA